MQIMFVAMSLLIQPNYLKRAMVVDKMAPDIISRRQKLYNLPKPQVFRIVKKLLSKLKKPEKKVIKK